MYYFILKFNSKYDLKKQPFGPLTQIAIPIVTTSGTHSLVRFGSVSHGFLI